MKKEKASNKALKHILCCLLILAAFVIAFTKVNAQTERTETIVSDTDDTVPLKPQLNESLLELKRITIDETNLKTYDKPRIIEKNIDYYIKENEETLIFFSEMFGYDINLVKQDIINRNNEKIEITNIGNLKDEYDNQIVYSNPEYGIVEYFYYINNNNLLERNRKIESYTGDSEYIEKLIMYYTKIYENVDTSIALSIGAAESGYYQVKYMLSLNNVYGGMSNSGLIRNDNIELGVLTYIRMLSFNYFGKGLDTVSEIGYVYCPTINDSGIKVASPHWINLVNTAKQKYDNYTQNIDIKELINH